MSRRKSFTSSGSFASRPFAILGLAIGALGAVGITVREAAAQFVPIRELDSNGVAQNEYPTRINGAFVTGSGSFGSNHQPLFWDLAGTHQLPLLAGQDTGVARASDVAGTMVGTGWNANTWTGFTALLWQNGVVVDLNTLVTSGPAALLFAANDLDEKGRILIDGETSSLPRTFLLDQGTLVDLAALDPTFGKGSASGAAINVHGTVVGVANGHAAVFENGKVIDLDDPTVMKGLSQATDVNRDGFTVGFSGPSIYFAPRAFLWDRTHVVELTTSPPATALANSINDFGDVVGMWIDPATSSSHACLWENGNFVDLNTRVDPTLGWELLDATDIDNQGRIVGAGRRNGVDTAYMLEPICNGTFVVYGTGCAGTGGLEPQLLGVGCPAPDRDFALAVVDGRPNAFGLAFLGSGTGSARVKPGCDVQVLPLVAPLLPVLLDGLGELWEAERLPAGTATFDINLQMLFFDPGAAHGIAATKPLALHFE